ncbi:unnamed protein product, partial [Tenebrio molitor]
MNSVQYLLKRRPLSYEDKVAAKALGRPTPNLSLKNSVIIKTRECNRYFNRKTAYGKFSWMCGCEEVNKLYCFVCLLYSELKMSPWVTEGITDLKHLAERASKHQSSPSHLNHLVNYSVLDKTDIRRQLDTAYITNVRAHNEKVRKNLRALRRLITCVRFSGAFELALRGHDEDEHDVLHGLVDFTSE